MTAGGIVEGTCANEYEPYKGGQNEVGRDRTKNKISKKVR